MKTKFVEVLVESIEDSETTFHFHRCLNISRIESIEEELDGHTGIDMILDVRNRRQEGMRMTVIEPSYRELCDILESGDNGEP